MLRIYKAPRAERTGLSQLAKSDYPGDLGWPRRHQLPLDQSALPRGLEYFISPRTLRGSRTSRLTTLLYRPETYRSDDKIPHYNTTLILLPIHRQQPESLWVAQAEKVRLKPTKLRQPCDSSDRELIRRSTRWQGQALEGSQEGKEGTRRG